LPASIAAAASASVIGAADAKDASAVATAPARMVALTVDFVDMVLFSGWFSARRFFVDALWSVRSGRAMCYIFAVTQNRDWWL
jgi:hypothetical protein